MEQASLQLAWEFRTGSLEGTTGWIVAMRDDANARVPASGPPYEIISVQDDVNAEYGECHATRHVTWATGV